MKIKTVYFGRTGDCAAVIKTAEQVFQMEKLDEATLALISDVMATLAANKEQLSTENAQYRAAVKLGMLLERQTKGGEQNE